MAGDPLDVQMPTLAEIVRSRRRRREAQALEQMPQPDAPRRGDPYIDALMQQEARAPRTFEPSGSPEDLAALRRQQMQARTFEPSGPAMPPQAGRTMEPTGDMAAYRQQMSPEEIRARVDDGSMDPRLAQLMLQRMEAY